MRALTGRLQVVLIPAVVLMAFGPVLSFFAARERTLLKSCHLVMCVVLVLVVGCTRSTANRTMLVGAGMTVAGLVSQKVAWDRPSLTDGVLNEVLAVDVVLSAIGVATFLVGAVGRISPIAEERPPIVSPEEQRRREIEQLTARAFAAVRIGQCELVRSIDVRMAKLDPDAHASRFVGNATIRRCVVTVSGAAPAR